MRTRVLVLVAVVGLAACEIANERHLPSRPTGVVPPTPPTPPAPTAVASYSVTLTASSSCADQLPSAARERSFVATVFSDNRIEWAASTLQPLSGHNAFSSAEFEPAGLSFTIDVERDPQSDDFHGLRDMLSSDTWVQISGRGRVEGVEGRLTGTLNGLFAFYEPVVPPKPNVLIVGRYCQATDHRVTFVKE